MNNSFCASHSSNILSFLIFTTTIKALLYYCIHFKDRKNEVQRGELIYSRPPNNDWPSENLNPGFLGPVPIISATAWFCLLVLSGNLFYQLFLFSNLSIAPSLHIEVIFLPKINVCFPLFLLNALCILPIPNYLQKYAIYSLHFPIAIYSVVLSVWLLPLPHLWNLKTLWQIIFPRWPQQSLPCFHMLFL